MNYPALVNRFNGSIWAITKPKLDEITAFVRAKAVGQPLAVIPEQREREPMIASRVGAVGVLSIMGTISQRLSMMDAASGGVSCERICNDFDKLMADPDVGAIVMNVDSPGGSVYGIPELTAHIHASRGGKKIIAVANAWAASAAYALATAADELYVTPSGEVGSIGVYTVHADFSKADEEAGVKFTIISAGKFKAEGNDMEPLDDEARDHIQEAVDYHCGLFVKAVARNRGVAVSEVVNGFGQGRMLVAPEAVKAGMADGIRTYEEVIAMAAKAAKRYRAPSARLLREQLEVA